MGAAASLGRRRAVQPADAVDHTVSRPPMLSPFVVEVIGDEAVDAPRSPAAAAGPTGVPPSPAVQLVTADSDSYVPTSPAAVTADVPTSPPAAGGHTGAADDDGSDSRVSLAAVGPKLAALKVCKYFCLRLNSE